MKPRWIQLSLLAGLVVLAGCATNSELTQKEKDRFARETERENQKQAQAQEKMLRQATQGQRSRDSFGGRR
ncbi:MAG: hypothetical protein Q7S40_31645 [Opitutaceae bacterium]|nr:hypothetical protein [Opitutaceae bacterium]